MLVRHRTLSAGPAGIRKPDEILDIPDDEAKHLIAKGFAQAAPDVANGSKTTPKASGVKATQTASLKPDGTRR